MRLIAAAALALATLSAPAYSADALPERTLIDRVIEAYGGRAALEQVRSYRLDGRIVATFQGREGPMVRLFRRPNRLRVELRYPGEPEIRIVDGAKGWRSTGGADPEVVTGPLLDAMILQAARANVPWILLERAAEARTIEPLERDGRTLAGIEIPLGAGLAFRAYVDPETHRVAVSQGRFDHHGMATWFETAYGDFRLVQGVWFAFREENFASGARTGETTIEKVTVNPKTGPADFTVPKPPKSSRTSS